MDFRTFFSGSTLDRSSITRLDTAELEAAWRASTTRFVAIWRSRCMIAEDAAVLLSREELGTAFTLEECIYLGKDTERHLFAVALPDTLHAKGPNEDEFDNFRGLLGNMSADDAALLAYAKGMVEWQQRHRYCGHCGSPNKIKVGGFVLVCADNKCNSRSFPRLDPAIIVLTVFEDKALLGRQVSWPEGRFSTIAGFVEPGESLEDAVRREVHEETNIQVSSSRYLASQPWPFPNAIMLGFHAEASSTDIELNDGELAEAEWLSREQLVSGDYSLPPPQSIAFQLIAHWFDQWEGNSLVDYALSSDFRRSDSDKQ